MQSAAMSRNNLIATLTRTAVLASRRTLAAAWLVAVAALPAAQPAMAQSLPTETVSNSDIEDPGAMAANGSFFVVKNTTQGTTLWEWDNSGIGAWRQRLSIQSQDAVTTPGGRTTTDGCHFGLLHRGTGFKPILLGWEPATGPINHGTPSARPDTLSTPSDVMYNNRVLLVGDKQLYERFVKWAFRWWHLNQNSGPIAVAQSKPCVLKDGHVFMVNSKGELWQMWWDTATATWNWQNHGYPQRALFAANRVKADSVGAAMPQSNKVFVTCSDGSLRQLYWDGAQWVWHNHGIPDGWRVSSIPTAIADGKLFVVAEWNSTRVLMQLFWDGNNWLWHNHRTPPGTSISGGVISAIGAREAAVLCDDGNYYLCQYDWATSNWIWKNCGHP